MVREVHVLVSARTREFNLRLFWIACIGLYFRVALDAVAAVRSDAPSTDDFYMTSARYAAHFNERYSFLVTRTIFLGSTDSSGDMAFLNVAIGAKGPLSENGQP